MGGCDREGLIVPSLWLDAYAPAIGCQIIPRHPTAIAIALAIVREYKAIFLSSLSPTRKAEKIMPLPGFELGTQTMI